MTFDELVVATGSTPADAIRFADPLSAAMALFAIDSPRRISAFLATVAIESGNLRKLEEDLYYKDPSRLADIYPRAFRNAADAAPYARNSRGLSELLYKGYHGRGLIQLTWLENYAAASEALGRDLVTDPDVVLEVHNAALTAAWFFNTRGCLPHADAGDMTAVTRIVNGKRLMHLDRRLAQYTVAMEVFS